MTPDEIRQYVKSHYALGLPNGSVRALLAVLAFGGIWVWMWMRPDEEVPRYLRDLMFIIMGHYFAARRRETPQVGPPPLYLPRGTVRMLLLGGFALVAGMLLMQHRMLVKENDAVRLSHASVTLILVAGFLLGVVFSRFSTGNTPRWVEDLRAILSVTAGVALLVLVFGFVETRSDSESAKQFRAWAMHYKLHDILAAVVGFYFGSRS
jgi:hypothetical protein